MKLGAFQFDVALGNPETNLARIFEGTRGLRADLLLLPELCTSGYLLGPEQARRLALKVPGPGLRPFEELARAIGGTVVAGIAESERDTIYNTAVVVGPQGFIGKQRKVHLTALERSVFRQGERLAAFALDVATVGVLTCFDAWFPEAGRDLCRQGVQLLCQPAAFGGPQTLDIMRVRSMENRVFSVTANRTGRESAAGVTADFRGMSQVVDCDGAVLVSAGREQALITCDIAVADADRKANVMCPDFETEWARYHLSPVSRR